MMRTAPPLPRRPTLQLATVAVLVGGLLAPSQATGETPKPPVVSLEKITVTPANPGPDTLCQLRVALRNEGSQPVSELAFRVQVNGQALAVYDQHLFMLRLEPGKTTELRLFNFWSSETSRPAPADGKYRVEVSLLAARWYTIVEQGGEEVWTPGEPVPGLPAHVSVTLTR